MDAPSGTGQGRSRESRRLFQLWKQLTVKDGLLWRAYEEENSESVTLQFVVPGQYRQRILQELHSGAMGGHLGTEKTHGRLKERFYWPGYWNDVWLFCEACTSCSTRKTPAPKRRAPLQSVQTGNPMELVGYGFHCTWSSLPNTRQTATRSLWCAHPHLKLFPEYGAYSFRGGSCVTLFITCDFPCVTVFAVC